MSITHWIYPTNEKSNYHLGGQAGPSIVSPENVVAAIEAERNGPDPWILTTGYRTMQSGDAVWIYASEQRQLIYALAQVMEVFEDSGHHYASLAWNIPAVRRLQRDPIYRSEYGQVVQQPAARANRSTTVVLENWLRGARIQLADLDGDSAEDSRLRVLRSIVQRQGQAIFRQRLLDAYERQCAVTGPTATEVLEAAHIGGYLGPQSNTMGNGLLLRADLHTLFDLYLIGVDADGQLVVSGRLDGTTYAEMRGKRLIQPRDARLRPSPRQLAAHLRRMEH